MIELLIFGLIFIVLLKAIGKAVNYILINQYHSYQVFEKWTLELFSGSTVLVFFLAVFFTTFNSVFILLLVIFAYLYLKYNINRSLFKGENLKFEIKEWWLIIFYLPIFLYQFWVLLEGGVIVDTDKVFYAEVSHYMLETGVEGIFNNMSRMYPEYFGNTPYHYFELWMNAFIIKFSPVNSSYSLVGIVFPILAFSFWCGIMSIISKLTTLKGWHYLLALLLLFFGPVYFNVYLEWFGDGNFGLNTTIFTLPNQPKNIYALGYFGQKHLVFYLFLSAALIFWIKGKPKNGLWVLIMAPIANIGLLPAVYGGVGIYLLWDFIKYKKIKQNLDVVLMMFLVAIGIGLFYWINQPEADYSISSGRFYAFFHELNLKGEIVRFFLKVLMPIIYELILFAPVVAVVIMGRKELKDYFKGHLKEFALISLFVFIAGVGTMPFMKGLDGGQFYTYSLPIINYTLIIILIYLLSQFRKSYMKITVFSILVFNLISVSYFSLKKKRLIDDMYSEDYIHAISGELLGKEDDTKFGYFLNSKLLQVTEPANWYTIKPGELIRVLHNQYEFFALDDPFVDYSKELKYDILASQNNQLKYYIDQNHLDNLSLDSVQLHFTKNVELEYLVVAENAQLPKWVHNLFYLIAKDSKSGEAVYKHIESN